MSGIEATSKKQISEAVAKSNQKQSNQQNEDNREFWFYKLYTKMTKQNIILTQ